VDKAVPPARWVLPAKLLVLAVVVLAAFLVIQRLLDAGYWLAVAGVAFVVMVIVVVYATRRFIPVKYLLPGLVFLVTLQIWPIVYTVATAFTNYGDGHLISKQESIDSIVANSVREVPGSQRYRLSVAVPEGADPATGEISFLLTDPSGKSFVGTADGLKDLPGEGVSKLETGKITAAPGFTVLNAVQVNARKDLNEFAVPTADGGGIKRIGLTQAFEGKPAVTYDARTDKLTDSTSGKTYVPRNATWAPEDGQGEAFPQGWKENVGFSNFTRVVTDPTLRSGFLGIFVWNLFFALFSVMSTFVLGMLIALLLNDPRLKGKAVYRSLLILPYALPGFITALIWASMYNQDFGLINSLTGLDVDWLGNAWAAKVAILITNLWLGFPYTFIVCTGALQSIPSDVREAARIDGASAVRTLRSIIMPLLLVAVGPLLIASFAFNFNNFGLIYLMTGGGPFNSGNATIGSSDLLITYAFRLAFSGTTPSYGFASAISVFIFLLVAVMSYAGFRRTKQLEEIN
jgi:arabinogalactan oligomer/maltooligosaccharide transport system permease protein